MSNFDKYSFTLCSGMGLGGVCIFLGFFKLDSLVLTGIGMCLGMFSLGAGFGAAFITHKTVKALSGDLNEEAVENAFLTRIL